MYKCCLEPTSASDYVSYVSVPPPFGRGLILLPRLDPGSKVIRAIYFKDFSIRNRIF